VAEVLPPGEWSLWLPRCFAEFVSPATPAARVRELASTHVELPAALLSLLSSLNLPTPRRVTFGALEAAATAPHSCVGVSKYCVDLFSCSSEHCGCGGQPRGGALSDAERGLFFSPLSLPLLAGQSSENLHYVDYERCVRLARGNEYTQLQQRVEVEQQQLRSARDALYVADACCPTVFAKALVRERRLQLQKGVRVCLLFWFFFVLLVSFDYAPVDRHTHTHTHTHALTHTHTRTHNSSRAQTNAVELAAVPHAQLRCLALQCCVSVSDMRDAVLHHATVAINRGNAGRRRRANPQQLSAAMSAADVHRQCTGEFLRAWLLQHNAGLRTSGWKKAQLVEAVVRCLRADAVPQQ
jgi:hypothetical protein